MNKEEFNKSLKDFLEQKTYIVAYRSNYDSARKFNNELINYIQSLQQRVNQLETNIDEALKTTKELYEEGVEWHWDNGSLEMYVLDLLSILERGKDVKDKR